MKLQSHHVSPWNTPFDFDFERAPSPLRYPGGKSRAIPIIAPLIMEGMRRTRTGALVSPFLGGGNLEVTCAQHGTRVFGSDILEPLVCFWEHLQNDPERLAEAVQKYLTANVNNNGSAFKQLQGLIPRMPNGLARAAAVYVVNRLSYRGLTLCGGKSYSARFNTAGIDKLRSFSAPSMTVQNVDFQQALRSHGTAFGYFDPPYEFVEEGRNRLYGVKGDAHRGFDHDALFEAVSNRPNWIMSLNADDHVLDRYVEFPKAFPRWSYGMSTNSESNEVLIFSRNLADLAGVARDRIAAAADARWRISPANDNGASAAAWSSPDLSVISETTTASPPFPKAILGEDWARWCEDVAAGANAHFDYVAATLLTVTAGLVGNAATVRANGAFIQPSILWMCLVGKSGAGKTPATTVLSDIVDDLERRVGRRHRLRDVTVAAAVKLAAENPKGHMLFRDELSGWWMMMKRTGGEDFWLEAHNGKPFSKDRMNDEPLFVERLSISVIGGAQPDTVKDITTDGKNRGFSARWLFAYPEPTFGYDGADVEIDIEWATNALARLIELPVTGACIPLSPEAQAIFRTWWDNKRREIADHDGLWAEWMQKQGGNALRLALSLELLKWSVIGLDVLPEIITTQTLQDALTLIDDWAIPMAQRTLEVMYRSRSERHAAALAKHLRRAKLMTFNTRLLRRGDHGRVGALRDAAAMDEACTELVRAGLIRHVGTRAGVTKGRTSQTYEVNPLLLAASLRA